MSARVGYVADIPIRFSDIDGFGHVNHAKYLTFCEDHRTVMFGQMATESGADLLADGFSVVRLECDYRLPLVLADGSVRVTCVVVRLGRSSVGLRYDLELDDRQVAQLRSVIVLTDEVGPRELTVDERQWLSRYLVEDDDPPPS